jgi:Type III restriction enzyme, res subunit
VLCAPPGWGKTVVATSLIAARGCSTPVLVHRKPRIDQWAVRLSEFTDISPKAIGRLGGGRRRTTKQIDIAMVQSPARTDRSTDFLRGYGHVLIDECHHVPAVSIERVLSAIPARYVTGLTATPALAGCAPRSDRYARCHMALVGPGDPWGGGAQTRGCAGCGLLRGRRGSRCGPPGVVCSLTLLAVSVLDAADGLPMLTAAAAGRQPRSVGRIARIGGRDRDRAAGAIQGAQPAGNRDGRAAFMMSWG